MLRTASILALLCAGVARAAPIDESRVVDLTHPFDAAAVYWPTARPFTLDSVARGHTPAGYWYAANEFCAAEHGGTHVDAPVHFAEAGRDAAGIPLAQLMGPAVVVDVRARAGTDPDLQVGVADLEAFEAAHGRIPDGAIVLVRTGWGVRWNDRRRYIGDDTPGDASQLHFPGVGRAAAAWLTTERRIDAVGIDTASIDHGPSRTFPAHRVLAAAQVPVFENLAGLERLPATGAFVIALPMKIAGGTGGPLRAIAVLPAPR